MQRHGARVEHVVRGAVFAALSSWPSQPLIWRGDSVCVLGFPNAAVTTPVAKFGRVSIPPSEVEPLQPFFLDMSGRKGMSGAPVYTGTGSDLELVGIFCGQKNDAGAEVKACEILKDNGVQTLEIHHASILTGFVVAATVLHFHEAFAWMIVGFFVGTVSTAMCLYYMPALRRFLRVSDIGTLTEFQVRTALAELYRGAGAHLELSEVFCMEDVARQMEWSQVTLLARVEYPAAPVAATAASTPSAGSGAGGDELMGDLFD